MAEGASPVEALDRWRAAENQHHLARTPGSRAFWQAEAARRRADYLAALDRGRESRDQRPDADLGEPTGGETGTAR
jgi:hypothetical protein